MIAYGIGILPLIRQLKHEFPNAKWQWYADDGGAGASFQELERSFTQLQEIGPLYGYNPESTKSIIITSKNNADEAAIFHPLAGGRGNILDSPFSTPHGK